MNRFASCAFSVACAFWDIFSSQYWFHMRSLASFFFVLMAVAMPLRAETITVFAAASMQAALAEAGEIWSETQPHNVTIAAAGSAVLARQIAQGAPADLYISASPDWMNWLEQRGFLAPGTRRDIAGNALVLVGSGKDGLEKPIETIPLAEILHENRLAVALTEAVPAGIYAREALTYVGAWEDVQTRLAETEHVRAALALVALGEAPLGIVYLSDALSEPRVHIVSHFPANSHSAIRYPAAVLASAKAKAPAQGFLTWLSSSEGQSILARHGFETIGDHG